MSFLYKFSEYYLSAKSQVSLMEVSTTLKEVTSSFIFPTHCSHLLEINRKCWELRKSRPSQVCSLKTWFPLTFLLSFIFSLDKWECNVKQKRLLIIAVSAANCFTSQKTFKERKWCNQMQFFIELRSIQNRAKLQPIIFRLKHSAEF